MKSPVDILLDIGRLLQRSEVYPLIPLREISMSIGTETKQQKLGHLKTETIIACLPLSVDFSVL